MGMPCAGLARAGQPAGCRRRPSAAGGAGGGWRGGRCGLTQAGRPGRTGRAVYIRLTNQKTRAERHTRADDHTEACSQREVTCTGKCKGKSS